MGYAGRIRESYALVVIAFGLLFLFHPDYGWHRDLFVRHDLPPMNRALVNQERRQLQSDFVITFSSLSLTIYFWIIRRIFLKFKN